MLFTTSAFLVSLFWFYLAYLRKVDSPKLNNGLLKIPSLFKFRYLITMGTISLLMFALRLLTHYID